LRRKSKDKAKSRIKLFCDENLSDYLATTESDNPGDTPCNPITLDDATPVRPFSPIGSPVGVQSRFIVSGYESPRRFENKPPMVIIDPDSPPPSAPPADPTWVEQKDYLRFEQRTEGTQKV